MIRFECDYTEGGHPLILERLLASNLEQTPGYSEDDYCQAARRKILEHCNCSAARVHFLVGGTQANATLIAAALRPHQGVISAETGHINAHEAGAIEATGHKVLPLPSSDGKITAGAIEAYVTAHWEDSTHEHIVQPGMVYLSHPTENGTTYTKAELTAISQVCKRFSLALYIDGARLGYALAAPGNDILMADLAALCDAFYIGGTKVGALFGEAMVITNPDIGRDFRYFIKQKGGLLAKGRLLGLQFDTLFTNDLYTTISRHAVEQALRIKGAFAQRGVAFLYHSNTNQQFPILTKEWIDALSKSYSFAHWQHMPDGKSAVRFCTSWATRTENVDALLRDIAALG